MSDLRQRLALRRSPVHGDGKDYAWPLPSTLSGHLDADFAFPEAEGRLFEEALVGRVWSRLKPIFELLKGMTDICFPCDLQCPLK